MERLIEKAQAMHGSDLHLHVGLPPLVRVDGSLVPMAEPVLTQEDCSRYARELLGREIPAGGQVDFAANAAGRRLRVNLFYSQGQPALAIRLLAERIPELTSLGLPPAALDLTRLRRGIVLVTGETGSGKSTTLAAMLNEINRIRKAHILTLEDPIEYEYTPDKCLVSQREVGRDTESYSQGLRAALREDPDVILIGEMRDMDTIETALTAAETGHLVFATLHTGSAPDSVDRIVSVFPEGRQPQVRMQLSMTLRAVITQQLLPKIGSGRALACELMIVNPAVRNLIREGKTPQIASTLATSAKDGCVTMDNSLLRLARDRRITAETAISAAQDGAYLKKALGLPGM